MAPKPNSSSGSKSNARSGSKSGPKSEPGSKSPPAASAPSTSKSTGPAPRANPKADRAPGLSHETRIAVLHGEEVFLRQELTAALKDALAKKFGEVDTITFDGSSATAAEVLDECRSFGLIAAHKLVLVDNAEQLVKEDNRPLFERYAESVIEQGEAGGGLLAGDGPLATLVLRAKTWRAGNLDKLIAQVGVVLACEGLDEPAAAEWAVKRAPRHACTLSRESAAALVERTGTDLARLDSELAKLAAAATTGSAPPAITPELIAQFVGRSREEEVWSIQSAMLQGSPQANLSALRDALFVSHHPPTLVFFAMTDLAKKLHSCAHAARSGANFYQMRGPLKLFGSGAERIFETARRLPPGACRRVLRSCLTMTQRDRTGLGDAPRSLERLAIEFADLSAQARR